MPYLMERLMWFNGTWAGQSMHGLWHRTIKACFPGMVERKWGRIMNVASTAAALGKDNHSPSSPAPVEAQADYDPLPL